MRKKFFASINFIYEIFFNKSLISTFRTFEISNKMSHEPLYQVIRTLPQYDNITNSEKNNKNVKNLSPYSPLSICYP